MIRPRIATGLLIATLLIAGCGTETSKSPAGNEIKLREKAVLDYRPVSEPTSDQILSVDDTIVQFINAEPDGTTNLVTYNAKTHEELWRQSTTSPDAGGTGTIEPLRLETTVIHVEPDGEHDAIVARNILTGQEIWRIRGPQGQINQPGVITE